MIDYIFVKWSDQDHISTLVTYDKNLSFFKNFTFQMIKTDLITDEPLLVLLSVDLRITLKLLSLLHLTI